MVENEIKVKEKAFIYAPELLKLPNSMLDQGYFNLLIRIAKLSLQNNRNREARKYLKKYKAQRGITFPLPFHSKLIALPPMHFSE